MSKEVNINLHGAGETIVRFGEAAKVLERVQSKTNTNFDGLINYVTHRTPATASSVIECNAENLTVKFCEDKQWPDSDIVIAKEVVNPKLQDLGLGTAKHYDRKSLIDMLKRNRHLLVADSADKIIASLSALSAKIEQNIDQGENNKGGKHNSFSQKVNLNTQPEELKFAMAIPLIVGQDKNNIIIDICYDAGGSSLVFWLECLALTELIEQRKEELVDRVKSELRALGYLVIATTD